MTDVYIAGVGMTPFGRHMDKSYKDLTAEAAHGARPGSPALHGF